MTLLSELGLLARVQDRRGEICFTAPPIGHSHPLICGVCRRVVRFDGNGDVQELESRLAARHGLRDLRPPPRGVRDLPGLPQRREGGNVMTEPDGPGADFPRSRRRGAAAGRPPLLLFVERRQGRLSRAARAVAAGGRPAALVCMLHEEGDRSRGHGLPLALLRRRQTALGVRLVTGATTLGRLRGHLRRPASRAAAAGRRGRRLRRHRPRRPSRLGRGRLRSRRPLAATCRSGRSRAAASSTNCWRAASGRPWSRSTPPSWTPRSSAASSSDGARRRARSRRRRRLRRRRRIPHHGHRRAAVLGARPARLGRDGRARRPLGPGFHHRRSTLMSRREHELS